ncbi:hypothetical protein SPRG_14832 [Saprolegnia parasitica CBS 223.65]|uniref:Uncharacterized protein n=1 Tax=Saprolegnia parasitica (strain CBS 223.65) TaxID=695850 RepID=A0A067BN48_SAPPC|nr:hypothetical protein SPRG_14832 [Saprolegnia parasitica CBS 223.65]KDO19924.1 hypothetical protein SPRG_14832 [Saprolegnia parasitica CBS 223.65]|eukprot:XP_012209363.1 hypothetical protein SPRG_14832 [Saprolegnia parasitica CBS 223.65]
MHFLGLLRAIQAKLAPLATTTRNNPRLDNVSSALAIDDNDDDDDMPPFAVAQNMAPAASPTPDEAAHDARLAAYEAAQFRAACYVMNMDELMSVLADYSDALRTLVLQRDVPRLSPSPASCCKSSPSPRRSWTKRAAGSLELSDAADLEALEWRDARTHAEGLAWTRHLGDLVTIERGFIPCAKRLYLNTGLPTPEFATLWPLAETETCAPVSSK